MSGCTNMSVDNDNSPQNDDSCQIQRNSFRINITLHVYLAISPRGYWGGRSPVLDVSEIRHQADRGQTDYGGIDEEHEITL